MELHAVSGPFQGGFLCEDRLKDRARGLKDPAASFDLLQWKVSGHCQEASIFSGSIFIAILIILPSKTH
jgi:hypothetical protein